MRPYRLEEQVVRDIRAGVMRYKDCAKEFGMSRSQFGKIRAGKTHPHIEVTDADFSVTGHVIHAIKNVIPGLGTFLRHNINDIIPNYENSETHAQAIYIKGLRHGRQHVS